MADSFSRRSLLERASVAVPFSAFAGAASLHRPTAHPPADSPESKIDVLTDQFPTQPPELVREMVTVSHFDLKRVQELVEAHPTLAKASWDWGFGDWEDGLGAASHMGNRPIAEYLISKGARPSLFSATMLWQKPISAWRLSFWSLGTSRAITEAALIAFSASLSLSRFA